MDRHVEKSSIVINATPAPVAIDVGETAVLVVDMQNDFGAPTGMFARAGIDVSLIRRAIDPIARLLEHTRQLSVPTVYLKMGFRPDLSDAGLPDSPNRLKHAIFGIGTETTAPDGRKSRVLIRDTWNTDIVDELRPAAGELTIYKTRYSGFYRTELDLVLQDWGIKHLLVTGCTTSVCVESTIRDAMFRDYHCVLLADCTAEPIGSDFSRTNHDASLLVIQTLFGSVSESACVIEALQRVMPNKALHPAAQ
jgi:ureidoacrylate peracid hydrolase